VAQNKAKYPDKYCPAPRCLWRTGGGYCPRHRHLEQDRETECTCTQIDVDYFDSRFCEAHGGTR
jgi:hypothetical protein